MRDVVILDYEEVLTETDLAWKLLLDSSDPWEQEKEWFPKSQCELDEEENTITVPKWLAIEKELV